MRKTIPAAAALAAALCGCGTAKAPPPRPPPAAAADSVASPPRTAAARPLRPGRIPPPLARDDVYAAGRPGRLAPQVRGDPARVYVPNSASNTVDVIDQKS